MDLIVRRRGVCISETCRHRQAAASGGIPR